MKNEGLNAIATNDAPAAIGAYSQGIVVGRFVFTSGQLPIDPATGDMPESVQDQTRLALANLEAVLKAGGSSLDKVVKVTLFLSDIADFKDVNEVYKRVFEAAGGVFPARSAVQVAALPKPGAKLEIEAVSTAI